MMTQMNSGDTSGQYFVVIYRPGSGWLEGKAIREQPTSEHVAYMKKLKALGTLVLGGPFKDSAGAMVIIECETLEAAKQFVDEDPAIQTELLFAEIHPWDPAATGQVDRRPW